MKKESLKLKILEKVGLTTIRHTKELLHDQILKHIKSEEESEANKYKQIHDIETKSNAKIKDIEKELASFKELYERNKKDLENKIKELKSENETLQNELKSMHEKYDGKLILEKLPPVKLKKSEMQTMKVSSRNAVRSRIARNSAKDVDLVEVDN